MEHLFSNIIDYRMEENAFDSSTVCSAVHYFHFDGVYFLFWPSSSCRSPTVSTKSFEIASNSILSDGPTG